MIAGHVAALGGSRLVRSAMRFALTVAAVLLLLLACRRSGERLGRLGERLEATEKTK